MFTDFVQLDGAFDDLDDDLPTPRDADNQVSVSRPSASEQRANFTLHRKRQLKNLRKDSTAKDLEIVINSNDENVNIYCSLGYYTKVAIPAFDHLSAGSTLYEGDIAVICHDVTKRTDATGAATTTVIMYRLYKQNCSVGQVTVHLHHTTRNVQLQGSAHIKDGLKAPVWFVQNLLKNRFKELAESQGQDIQEFNKSVADTITRHLAQGQRSDRNVCSGCHKNFNGRSVPEQCSQCSLYYHKYKCYQSSSHTCHPIRRSVSCSDSALLTTVSSTARPTKARYPTASTRSILHVSTATSTLPQNHSLPPTGLGSQAAASPQHASTGPGVVQASPSTLLFPTVPGHVPPPTIPSSSHAPDPPADATTLMPTSNTPTPTVSAGQISLPALINQPSGPTTACSGTAPSSQHMASITSHPSTTLNPAAAPFVSVVTSQGSSLPGTSGAETTKRAAKGKSKKAPAQNEGGLALEYAKYEVNVTQTKLRELEIKNKDLGFKNSILEARVADLETKQKQNIYDRYFPMPDTENVAPSNYQEPEITSNRSSHCFSHVPHCRYQPRCCHGCHSSLPTEVTFDKNLEQKLINLNNDIKELETKIDVLTEVTVPQIIRQTLDKLTPPITNTQPVEPQKQQGTQIVTEVDSMAEQDMNDASHNTIDDDIHEISVDLN